MFQTVLLPLDGSALAARALPFARRLASTARGRLIVVRAHLPQDDLTLRLAHPRLSRARREAIERDMAEAELEAACGPLREAGLDVEPHLVEGVAADVILETAQTVGADLVVLSTHGRGGLGRWLYGSVADEVLRHLPVPVLLVSAVCVQRWDEHEGPRVVVPLDGSSFAAEALGPARDLAEALGGGLLLLAVIEPTTVFPGGTVDPEGDAERPEQERAAAYVGRIAAELRSSHAPPVSTRIAHGDAADQICEVAREVGAGAIAMASHGRGGAERVLLGSVATRTLHRSSVPLLVYRPLTLRQTELGAAIEHVVAKSAAGGRRVRSE